MAVTLLDQGTITAVNAAAAGANGTREAGIVTALADAFSGNVTMAIYAAGTLLATVVRGPWVTSTSGETKSLTIGAYVSWTYAAAGTPTRVVFKDGSTEVFECSAGLAGSGGDLEFWGPIASGVPVSGGSVTFYAASGLDEATGELTVSGTIFISDETRDELASRALASDPHWTLLSNWCNASLNFLPASDFGGAAPVRVIGNHALAYFVGKAIGHPNADAWAEAAIRYYNCTPYFAGATQESFQGLRYFRRGAYFILSNTKVGVFSLGETVVGRTSGATAKFVAHTTAANGYFVIENIVGTFTTGEVVQAQSDPARTFVFNGISRPVGLMDSGYALRNIGLAYSMMYDWLDGYSGLTPAIKAEIRTLVADLWLMGEGTLHPPYRAFNWAPTIGNYHSGIQLFKVLAGLILWEDDPTRLETAIYDYGKETEFLETYVNNSGLFPEGHNYNPGISERYIKSLLALKTKTNVDTAALSGFVRNVSKTQCLIIGNGNNYGLDDGYVNGVPVFFSAAFAVGQRYFGRGSTESKELARYFSIRPPSYTVGSFPSYWDQFLFYMADESLPASPPLSMGLGPMLAKNGYAANDTTVWMSAGPYYNGMAYQKVDQGSLRVSRQYALLVVTEYGIKTGWTAGYPTTYMQNYCTVHGRTGDANAQQYPTNIGIDLSGSTSILSANYVRAPNSERGLSHFEDGSSFVFGRVPYRTSYFRNNTQTLGPYIDRIARSTLFVRPGVVFAFDAFTQAATEPNSYIQTNWHFPRRSTDANNNAFPLATTAPVVTNSSRDVVAVNGTSKLWAHMAYPTAPATNAVAEYAGRYQVSYKWTATPTVAQKQFFLHVFRAGDTTGYGDPTYTDISATNVFGCLVTGLNVGEGSAICGVFVDNGTDTVPTSATYTVAQSATATHYVCGLKKNTAYTVGVSDLGGGVTVTITEGGSSVTGDSGVLEFQVL